MASSLFPNNNMNILSRFRQFASGFTPEKAKAEVERLISEGRMSRQEFEQLKKDAQDFAKMLKF